MKGAARPVTALVAALVVGLVVALLSTASAAAPAAAPRDAAAAPAGAAGKPPPEPGTLEVGQIRLLPLAQLRVRSEWVPDRSLVAPGDRLVVSHRARLGGKASLEGVDLVIQLQDVRAWGSERVTDGLPPDPTVFGKLRDGVQLYEAFIGVHLGEIEARVGRQAISIANERLVGKAEFAMPGRAFDAVRLFTTTPEAAWSVFGAILGDDGAPAPVADGFLAGASLEMSPLPWLRLSPAVLHDGTLAVPRQRTTLGARLDGGTGGFGYDVEGWAQTTFADDAPVTLGLLAGARATWEFEAPLHPKVGLLTDIVSGGTGTGGALAPFDTLFGTNHGFYGHADMFTALPLHTKGQGLVDSAATVWIHEGPWSALAAFHAFAPFDHRGPDIPLYGVEPDIFGSWKPMKNLSLEAGCALFIPTGTALGRGPRAATWAYAQIQAWL